MTPATSGFLKVSKTASKPLLTRKLGQKSEAFIQRVSASIQINRSRCLKPKILLRRAWRTRKCRPSRQPRKPK
jgi:hypothetical protein